MQYIISPGCNHWNRSSTTQVSPAGPPRAHPDPHTITHTRGKTVPGQDPGQEEVPGLPVPFPLKLCACSGHRGEHWAGSLMPPGSNLLYMALALCTSVYFSVKWAKSLLEDQRRLWEDGSAVNIDMVIIILIALLPIVNGVTADQEWREEKGVCTGVACCVSSLESGGVGGSVFAQKGDEGGASVGRTEKFLCELRCPLNGPVAV